MKIVELGGANSCVIEAIFRRFPCAEYEVVDKDEYGLSLLRDKVRKSPVPVRLRCEDVLLLNPPSPARADLVFSLGLIEHFDRDGTDRAIQVHFDLLRPGGIAIVTFPTPTTLYGVTRGCIELMGRWLFHDERPLEFAEVLGTLQKRGTLLDSKILWPILLTQGMVVARKHQVW